MLLHLVLYEIIQWTFLSACFLALTFFEAPFGVSSRGGKMAIASGRVQESGGELSRVVVGERYCAEEPSLASPPVNGNSRGLRERR